MGRLARFIRFFTEEDDGNGGGSAVLKTVTGAILHITDALAKPAKKLVVNIEPVQSGSGDPSPENIRPITGYTGCEISHTGGNLFDESTATTYNRYIQTSTNTWKSSGDSRSYTFDCEPNKTYIVSASNEDVTIFRVGYITLDSWTGSSAINVYGTVTRDDAGSLNLTTGADAKKIVVQVNASLIDGGNTGCKIQELSTYSFDWEDEVGTVYGGTLDVTTGKFLVTHKALNISDPIWYKASESDYRNFCASTGNLAKYDADNPTVFSSHYKSVCYNSGMTSSDDNYIWIWNSGGSIRIAIKDTSHGSMTTANFKKYLLDNNVQIVYELETPLEYQITPTQVQMLIGENNLLADTNGELELEYYADGNVSESANP